MMLAGKVPTLHPSIPPKETKPAETAPSAGIYGVDASRRSTGDLARIAGVTERLVDGQHGAKSPTKTMTFDGKVALRPNGSSPYIEPQPPTIRPSASMLTLLLCASAALRAPEPSSMATRRGIMAAAATSLLTAAPTLPANAAEPTGIDHEGHPGLCMGSTVGGDRGDENLCMAPPPLWGVLTYDQALAAAAANEIRHVQIAPQHDQLFITTTRGSRWALTIKDEEVPGFITDAMRDDGTVPFAVLPLDPVRAQVREIAKKVFGVAASLFIADELDILPWDSTNYGSIKEREDAYEKMARGEKVEGRSKPLAEFVRRCAAVIKAKGPPPAKPKESLDANNPNAGVGRGREDAEALRRVLGLEGQWDAASEMARNQATKVRSTVMNNPAHKRVVQAHDEYIVPPTKKIVTELKTMGERVREAPWVTPATLTRPLEELPTLEELFDKAVHLQTEFGVSQYLRAHPQASGPVLRIVPIKKGLGAGSAVVKLMEAEDPTMVPNYAKHNKRSLKEGFESTYNGVVHFCRICPEFSAFYGHRVYICKRPEAEPAVA